MAPRIIARVGRGMGWAALAVAGVLILAVAGPLPFGARPHTVLTGSMEPAIAPGDLVVDQQISPLDARPGDVVTFRDPEDQSRYLTHRVKSVRRSDPYLAFVTQGDANNSVEKWRIRPSGELGRVLYTVPWVGHVAVFSHTRLGFLLVFVLPLLLLGLEELRRIWRPGGGRSIGAAG